MAASNAASGSQTATLATDHTLATITVPTGGASYVLYVDKSNLTSTERLRLRLRARARAADSTVDAYETEHTQDGADLIISPVISLEAGSELIAILRQEGGTGRAFPWAVRRIDG